MITTVNPATGETIAIHAELSAPEIEERIGRAYDAWRDWRLSPLEDRSALLERLADSYEANRERLGRMCSLEMGKTLQSAIAEVKKCAAGFRHYARNGPAMLDPVDYPLANGGMAQGRWLSRGIVLAVMPWNFPYWQAVRFLAPAIMAGNVGLLKHASIVQGCAALMEEMMGEVGAPAGLFQNLCIRSGAVADIIADPRITAVTLTGSEGAGRAVAEQAGSLLKKVVLELGGSDPFIVMPSADLDEAVKQAVTARTQNTGQSCICGKRMIVHADIHDEFLEKFTAAMRAVKPGDPFDADSDMGPLSSIEQRDTVIEQLSRAQEAGATLQGGEIVEGKGAFLNAGILTGVPIDSDIAREEIFGPVAMVFRAADIDEAIAIANDIPFGLGSSVWTRDEAEQERFVRDIEAGMTAINRFLASSPEAPFGGIKNSGHGRELAAVGLHEFMNLKTVMRPG